MPIMQSMVLQNKESEEFGMEERVCKVMRGVGAWNLALGIVGIVVGVAGGILLIISGAKLLAGKSKILF